MESKEQGIRSGIPRLSRVPIPRATLSTKVPDIYQGDRQPISQLPRPSASRSLRLSGAGPLSHTANKALQYNHGPNSDRESQQSNVHDNFQPEQTTVLETTPPSQPEIPSISGDENLTSDTLVKEQGRRKPRPSLSERTLETLSHIPPSPSPSRPRYSTVNGGSGIIPPSRPRSSLRSSRSNADLNGQISSSAKQPTSLPQRSHLLGKDAPPVPKLTYDNRMYSTPSKTSVNGSRIAASGQDRRTSQLRSVPSEGGPSPYRSSLSTNHALKAKTVHEFRGIGPKSPSTRPSLTSVFKNPTSHGKNNDLSTSSLKRPASRSLKNRSDGPNSASSLLHNQVDNCTSDDMSPASGKEIQPKSSLTLKQTIAKAKAEKRGAAKATVASRSEEAELMLEMPQDVLVETTFTGDAQKTLQRRIENAVTTGILNIAALNLKCLPENILTMYDFDQNVKISWSEAVDLTKLIAADNDLEELEEKFFPDWPPQELQEDDEKSNLLGGLEILDLRGNRLYKLPLGLRRLERLHTLILSDNNLDMTALSVICQIPNLKDLRLSGNDLEGEIPSSIADLSELQVLDLHSNRLSALPRSICELQKLQKLDLSKNSINTLSISKLLSQSLVDLNVSYNALSKTLFWESPVDWKLQSLNVAANELRSLCDSSLDLPKLQTLICDNNRLEALPDLNQLRLLGTLTASNNKIENLPEGLTNLHNLRNMDFGANQIRFLDPCIGKMKNLTTFNIVANPLRDRKYLAMSTSDLKIDLVKRLAFDVEDSDCTSQNELPESLAVPTGNSHPAAKYHKPENGILNLSSLGLSRVDPSTIKLDHPVHTLRMSHNDLTSLPISLLEHPMVRDSLRSLDISHNQSLHPMEYLPKDISLPLLRSLYIVSTGLTSLNALMEHLSAPQLEELNISCHRMTGEIPKLRTSFPSLTTFLATDNWFTSIDVNHIQGLEVIDVSNNDIEYLPPKIGELGNLAGAGNTAGRLRAFACAGNKFRVPRPAVVERGTEAILRDLRRMVPVEEVGDEWRE